MKKPTKRKRTAEAAEKRASKAQALPEDKRARIAHVRDMVNRNFGYQVMRQASKASTSYLLRRPTGITSLDIALGGGFPASAPSVIVGPDGVGKDYLAWLTCAQVQRIYGDNFGMIAYFSEFKPDKPFMRNICGLQIAMTPEELEEWSIAREEAGIDPLTEEEMEGYRTQIGEIEVSYGISADSGLDVIMACVESNAFQVAVVNSIGFLQTEAKEDVDSFADFAQRSSEAALLTKFTPKLAMYLNRGDPADWNMPNETALLLIDQVRAKEGAVARGRPLAEKEKYRPASGAWAMKHGKAIELVLHKGPVIVVGDGDNKKTVGRQVTWRINKGKLGIHDGVEGKYNYFYDRGVDLEEDLVNVGLDYGVLEKSGNWISLNDDSFECRVNGRPAFAEAIRETEGLFDHLRRACFRAAKVVYRHHDNTQA